MSLLGAPLELWDVHDVEALVFRALLDEGGTPPWELEDRAADLIGFAWELSQRYHPDKQGAKRWTFEQFCYFRLRCRIVDLRRKQHGRTKWVWGPSTFDKTVEKPARTVVSLDGPAGDGELGELVGTRAGDPTDDRDPTLGRLLDGGDRHRARDLAELGLEPPRRAA